uniref:hypothetical protein n=1 Tax=Acetatifactor sp. TaxID=1872090 RepID=UPI0040560D8D
MQYFVSHYWQQGENKGASLVLQQAFHKRRKMPVLLAAVGQEESAGFATELVDWYYGKGLSLCSKYGEQGMEEIAKQFQIFMKETMTARMTGIFCVGSSFVIFKQGDIGIRLLNHRHNRSFCHEIRGYRSLEENVENSSIGFRTGMIQKGVGLVFATEEFYRKISNRMLEECLNVKVVRTQEQADKRLNELGKYVEKSGVCQSSAILLVTG